MVATAYVATTDTHVVAAVATGVAVSAATMASNVVAVVAVAAIV